MNKITVIATILTVCMLTLASCSGTRSMTKGGNAEGMSRELQAAGKNVKEFGNGKSESIAKAVAQTYTPWTSVSLKGKARTEGIPVSLGVKLYMEYGKSVILSLSAPLLGEVGRIEISPDSLLMVNKRGKCYSQSEISTYMGRFGASITDVQDLFLGRVFLLGAGTLNKGNASLVDVSEGAGNTLIFTPRTQDPRAQYGFTLYEDGRMLLAAASTTDEKYMATAQYDHVDKGTDMELVLKLNSKKLTMYLSFGQPDFSPTPISPISINGKWERLSPKALFKSFG